MPHHHKRKGPRAMPLQKIAERCGVPVAQPKPIIIAHLPPPDEGVEPKGSEIRLKKRPWDDGISIGKLRAAYSPRGGVAK